MRKRVVLKTTVCCPRRNKTQPEDSAWAPYILTRSRFPYLYSDIALIFPPSIDNKEIDVVSVYLSGLAEYEYTLATIIDKLRTCCG